MSPSPVPLSDAASTALPDSPVPYPPRYWWLKRISGAALFLALGLVILHVWWGNHAQSILQFEIAKIRAAGEPISPSQLDCGSIPDEENAAALYVAAGTMLDLTPDDARHLWSQFTAGNFDDDRLGRLVDANAGALDLYRQARGLTNSDWGLEYGKLYFDPVFPQGTNQGYLSQLVVVQARTGMSSGDYHETIECALDLLAHARALAQARAPSGYWRAMRRVQDLTNMIAWIQAGPGGTPVGETTNDDGTGAAQNAVIVLRNQLLDESFLQTALRDLCFYERVRLVWYLEACANGRLRGEILNPRLPQTHLNVCWHILRPMWTLDVAKSLRYWEHRIQGISAANSFIMARHIQMASAHEARRDVNDQFSSFTRSFTLNLNDDIGIRDFQFYYFATVASSRMAATALAIYQYELDRGKRPAQLDDLVPEYLDAIPRDPFTVADPIRYLPAAQPARLYVLGENQRDDGGHYNTQKNGWIHVEAPDIAFLLEAAPPAPPPGP